MNAISVKNLNKSFSIVIKQPGLLGALRSFVQKPETKIVDAVKNISFTIEPGELVGFLGPNGAGKTTTMKMLSGLLYPTSGEILILGHVPWHRKPVFQRQFSMVMGQRTQLWWDLPARETFRLNQKIFEIPEHDYQKRLGELVDLLELAKLIDTPVKKLSLGERMKSELVCALLHQPRVILLDEPTLGLDVVMQKKLREFILHYKDRTGATILLTSHNMDDVQELCQRVVVINDGSLLYDGSLDYIAHQYASGKWIHLRAESRLQADQFKIVEDKISNLRILENSAQFQVQRDHISQVVSTLLAHIKTSDLSIEELPIEDIIHKMFIQVR